MSQSINGWRPLRSATRSALLAALGLGFGITLAFAQQGQKVPKSPGSGAEESTWAKICTKDPSPDAKQVCLIKHEGLEPKTGAVLIAAAVRIIEGDDKQHLLVNVPTAYSLVVPSGVQVKVDEGQPVQLQYSICLPTNCQVQMELSKDMAAKMRAGKELYVAAMNVQGKTMAFPIPLEGFAKTSDGPPVNNAAYQEARNQMLQAARQHQIELAKEAQQNKQRGVGTPQAAPPPAAPQ